MKKRVWSYFDLAVIALLLLGAFTWMFVLNRPVEVQDTFIEGNQARYFIEVGNITIEQVQAVSPGDFIQEGARHLPLGRVVAVEYHVHEIRVEDEDTETILLAPSPTRFTMILTVETEVVELEHAILAEGQFAIRGGLPISFTGPGFAFTSAFVLGWDRGDR